MILKMSKIQEDMTEQIKELLLQRYNDVEKEVEQINIQIEELKLKKRELKKRDDIKNE